LQFCLCWQVDSSPANSFKEMIWFGCWQIREPFNGTSHDDYPSTLNQENNL